MSDWQLKTAPKKPAKGTPVKQVAPPVDLAAIYIATACTCGFKPYPHLVGSLNPTERKMHNEGR